MYINICVKRYLRDWDIALRTEWFSGLYEALDLIPPVPYKPDALYSPVTSALEEEAGGSEDQGFSQIFNV